MLPRPPLRSFGATGLTVPALGLGAGHLGGSNLDDAGVDAVLGAALDAGIALIDAARSYGRAEERIALAWAVRSVRFRAIETSVNLCDQRVLDEVLPAAAAAASE